MAKINYNLLRQRIHWVDDYAAGIKWSDLLAKYESEGIKPGRLQSAIEAAQKIGIISGSYAHEGTVTMDATKREELMAGVDPEGDYKPLQATTERVKVAPSPLPPSSPAVTLSPLELETLREIAGERIQRDRGAALRSGTPQETPTSVRLDSGLWDALMAYRDAEGIGRSEAMNRAIEALLGAR